MKSLYVEFEAPIIFKYSYAIDEDEIIEETFEEYIGNLLLKEKRNIADSMYQNVREDLAWDIEQAITLKNAKIKNHNKNEFDF